MQVYVELALLENFCMDFTLLYCAKLVSKNRAHVLRLVIASVFGACFAVVFPLFKSGSVLSVIIKIHIKEITRPDGACRKNVFRFYNVVCRKAAAYAVADNESLIGKRRLRLGEAELSVYVIRQAFFKL